jgi:hypothetical protein
MMGIRRRAIIMFPALKPNVGRATHLKVITSGNIIDTLADNRYTAVCQQGIVKLGLHCNKYLVWAGTVWKSKRVSVQINLNYPY